RVISDIYLKAFDGSAAPAPIFRGIDYMLGLRLVNDRILAITDRDAPNRRIVEIRLRENGEHDWIDLVPETDSPISNWAVAGDRMFVFYVKDMKHRVVVFDLCGKQAGGIEIKNSETLRLAGASQESDELLLETESFTEPVAILRYSAKTNERTLWARKRIRFDSSSYGHSQVSYQSKDGTQIPMYLVGRHDVLGKSGNPTIMTSYGGYGVPMTPQFSIFVSFLLERG